MTRGSRLASGFVLGGVLFCEMLLAQQGSITGQVVDPTDAAVPGAQVTVKNQSTGATFSASTDDAGFYRAPQLIPGTYTITVGAAGFSSLVRQRIDLRVDDRLRIDFRLQVGGLSEQISVTGAPPLLQTEDSTAGQVVDNQRIVELPLNGRNWLQLATLAPGSVTYPGAVDTGAGNAMNVLMNLGGTRSNQANYLLDGTDNTMYLSSGTALIYPPVDSLQEFKVQTNNYTADTGRLGGAVVNATIKSGSNGFHGTGYEFFRNRVLNAKNFFASPTATKPQFTRNQFGASLGGPLRRNRLFFFLNYEGTRQRQAVTLTRQVFTDAQKAGDFSANLGPQIGADALGRPVYQGEIFDPFSVRRLPDGTALRDAFLGNVIPLSRMNPVAKTLINLVPPPNAVGSPNFIRNLSSPLNFDTVVSRIDWVRSEKDVLTSHFIFADQNSSQDPLLGYPADGGNALSLNSNQRQFGLGWTHVFTSNHLNEFLIGYVRNTRLSIYGQADQDLNAHYGLPFPFPGIGVGGMANLSITGYTTIGTNGGDFPQFVNKYEVSDSYNLIHGSHSFKFGFRTGLKLFQNQRSCNNCRGTVVFNGVDTQQPGFSGTGSAIADFLTGVANNVTLGNVRNEKDVGRDIDAFVQDRWRVNPRLTVTVGVRYQFNPPSWEARDLVSNVLFGPGFTNAQVVVPQGMDDATLARMKDTLLPFITVRRAPELDRGLVRNKYLNFAPRVGIAYQLGPKTVLRTGYGVFFGFPDIVSGAVLTLNPPANLSITGSSNQVDPTLIINQPMFGADPFNRALTNPAYFSIRDPNMPPEFIQMYNLTIQHQFAPSWLLEVGFIGNHSSHVLIATAINDAIPALPSDTSSVQSRRRVSKVLSALPYLAPQGFSTYNSLTLNVEKRFSQGLSLLANYTWSRALGVAPAVTEGINNTPIENPVDLKREYGPLEFDVVKRVSLSLVYDLPFGKGKRYLNRASKVVDQVAGGWELTGITTFQGGFPITPVLSYSLGKTDTNSRPNAIGDPTNSARQPYNWVSPSAFAIPSNAEIAAGNFFGNAGWNCMREPGLVNLDFSVLKNIGLSERFRMQFRTEVFNITNTPFFGSPGSVGTIFNTPTFGKVTAAGDPRVIQFGLKLIF